MVLPALAMGLYWSKKVGFGLFLFAIQKQLLQLCTAAQSVFGLDKSDLP